MKTIITGGAGFIGANAAMRYMQKGHRVVVVDNLSREGSRKNLDCATECLHSADDPGGSRTSNRVGASVAVKGDRLVRGMQWWSASRGHEIGGPGPARNDRASRGWQRAERLVSRRRPVSYLECRTLMR